MKEYIKRKILALYGSDPTLQPLSREERAKLLEKHTTGQTTKTYISKYILP